MKGLAGFGGIFFLQLFESLEVQQSADQLLVEAFVDLVGKRLLEGLMFLEQPLDQSPLPLQCFADLVSSTGSKIGCRKTLQRGALVLFFFRSLRSAFEAFSIFARQSGLLARVNSIFVTP